MKRNNQVNIYKLSQTVNNNYDTYDSCVVAAEDAEIARRMHPDGTTGIWWNDQHWNTWAYELEQVTVTLIGETIGDHTSRVICASFNAG